MASTATENYLYQILTTLEPTQCQKSTAARSENFLRDILHESRLPVVGSYLSGSYARGTALRPIDDVDIVFLVQPEYWQRNSWLAFGRPSPKHVLETFARAIRYRYQESSVWLQKCSVNLSLQKLQIDVVPAIPVGSSTTAVYIGNQFTGEWTLSNPKEHTRKATEINRTARNLFKPLVKLVKFWNSRLPSTARVKSFFLETIGMHFFSAYPPPSRSEGLIYFWDHLLFSAGEPHLYNWRSVNVSLSWWNISVPDVGKTGRNIVANVSHDVIIKLVKHARVSRDEVLAAGRSRTHQASLCHWQRALKI